MITEYQLEQLDDPSAEVRLNTLCECFPGEYWLSYPMGCLEDLIQMIIAVYKSSEPTVTIQYLTEYFRRRQLIYLKDKKIAQESLNNFLQTYKQPPTKHTREVSQYNNKVIYETLLWLDIIWKHEQYHDGFYYLRDRVDSWCLNWLRRYKQEEQEYVDSSSDKTNPS